MSKQFPKASKEKEDSDGRSQWSRVEPDARLQNEKQIWKTKLYEKNQKVRRENAAVGTLGQYSIGDLDLIARLDQRLKAASTRPKQTSAQFGNAPKFSTPNRQSFEADGKPISELISKRKPTTLEPLPFDIQNNEVKYQRKRNSRAASCVGSNLQAKLNNDAMS